MFQKVLRLSRCFIKHFYSRRGGRVEIGEKKEVDKKLITLDPSTFDLQKNVMVPPNSLVADKEMIETRFPKVVETLEKMKLDKTFGDSGCKNWFCFCWSRL